MIKPKINEINGESIEYPGHFIPVSLFIIELYDSLDNATEQTFGKYPDALINKDLHASSFSIRNALSFLKEIVYEKKDIYEVYEKYSSNWNAGGIKEKLELTKCQGEKLFPLFKEKISKFTNNGQ